MTNKISDRGSQSFSDNSREQVDGVPRLLVLAKAWDILDAFSASRPELTITELVSRTNLPTSTCVRIVRNLAHDGLLERTGDRYRIGLAVVRWGSLALQGRSLVEISTETLNWLRDETGESALLCVRDGRSVVVIATADSHHSVLRALRVGEVSPLHAGSTGKAFLAFDPAAFELVRTGKLEALTSQTITDRSRLLKEIDEIREQGFATSKEERNTGAAGITAPIFDATGKLAGSIGLTGPVNRMSQEHIDAYSPVVLDASRRITNQLGHRPLKEE